MTGLENALTGLGDDRNGRTVGVLHPHAPWGEPVAWWTVESGGRRGAGR